MKVFSLAIFFLVFLFSSCSVKKVQVSNVPEPDQNPDEIKVVVEDMPTFQGGDVKTFEAWVQEHVKYPEDAAESGVEGDVYIMFFVETDGSVSNVTVLRGVHPALDHEALKVVQSSPKWEYQNKRGDPVRARFSITVKFVKE